MSDKVYYITIGNTDNKLTQQEWAQFSIQIYNLLNPDDGLTDKIYGSWYSLPNAPWQNAYWCVEIPTEECLNEIKDQLAELAGEYGQDSIAFATAEVEMIEPV